MAFLKQVKLLAPALLLSIAALAQEGGGSTPDSQVRTVQIIAGVLAALCVVAIILRRRSKKKKAAAEDDF
ncbi:MAG: hypothetical protein HYZ57_11365 [Acidobacteria bacterium]|nr:hypothetical protein [Acidobacteriota bacterium]MBI3280428.1 hypothetical protein [Acidobacteriota bacterium]